MSVFIIVSIAKLMNADVFEIGILFTTPLSLLSLSLSLCMITVKGAVAKDVIVFLVL